MHNFKICYLFYLDDAFTTQPCGAGTKILLRPISVSCYRNLNLLKLVAVHQEIVIRVLIPCQEKLLVIKPWSHQLNELLP